MSTPPLTQLEKLELALQGGVIDQATFDIAAAALEGGLAKGSATAIGNNAEAMAAGSVRIDGHNSGFVNAGVYIAAARVPGATPQQLRRGYLSRIWSRANQLPLFGGDNASQQISLSSVYTALLTTASQEDDLDGVMHAMNSSTEKAHKSASALDVLNAEKKLVLLSGPGGGKSTFVNFVALSMAGEMLGSTAANLATLTAPVPRLDEHQSKDKTENPKPQRWDHGALLPVHIVLRDFAAQLPDVSATVNASTVLDHIKLTLKSAGIEKFFDSLHAELLGRGCLVLLDGLDEVPDVKGRRLRIKQAVQGFAATFANCRFLVTSRTYAYQNQEWKLDGFHAVQLLTFTRAQIARFADAWYAHMVALNRLTEGVAKARADVLKREVARNPRIHELAARPLLLTLMARLQTDEGGSLPEKREALYDKSVEMLLNTWETMKVRMGAEGQREVEPSLTEWLSASRDNIRKQLNRLAFEAHRDQADLKGTASITQAALIDALLNASDKPEQLKPVALANYLSDRSGILTAKANGLYEFPHRTFQEYLAACHLTQDGFPEKLAALAVYDTNRWREVTLLAGSTAARAGPLGVWALAEALCHSSPPNKPELPTPLADQTGALLAACVLVESAELRSVAPANQGKLNRIRDWQLNIMRTGALPSTERARAGRNLAALGDPRAEVMTLDGMQFCWVPGGEFVMGDDNSDSNDGKPAHCQDLPQPYFMARFPVTVAQWREHLVATKSEASQVHDEGLVSPRHNDPMTAVSWACAMTFCNALTKRWSDLLPPGHVVSLPTEPEWEKAGRGGTAVPTEPRIVSLNAIAASASKSGSWATQPNLDPARDYPWAANFNSEQGNADRTLDTTSAVGCYATGASPYGCEEMSGSVWEWTFGEYDGYPYTPACETLQSSGTESRVVRGGSWLNSANAARCDYRRRLNANRRVNTVGFRVVLRPAPIPAALRSDNSDL